MIFTHEYPICEFDTEKRGIICAADHFEKTLPEMCVMTFFRTELNALVQEMHLEEIGKMHSEIVDVPLYLYEKDGKQLVLTMPLMYSAGAAGCIDELQARGCKKFIICGGAGSLVQGSGVGEIMLPVSAVRDEGASYHYLPPSREAEAPGELLKIVAQALNERGVPFTLGKTWTTDAFFRETPDMVERRRREGCRMVEMETAAFYAAAQFYGVEAAQLLYAGDDVSGATWEDRSWNKREDIRRNLIELCLDVAMTI